MEKIKVEYIQEILKNKNNSIWYEGLVARLIQGGDVINISAVGGVRATLTEDSTINFGNEDNLGAPLNDYPEVFTDDTTLMLSPEDSGVLFDQVNAWHLTKEGFNKLVDIEVYLKLQNINDVIEHVKDNFEQYYVIINMDTNWEV